jgi:hypothetical protein
MKKIALSLIALTALSSAAFAGSAFQEQMARNMLENPGHYSFPVTTLGGATGATVAGDALAIEVSNARIGVQNWAGPGEDGRQGR